MKVNNYDKHIVFSISSSWIMQVCVLITSILHCNREVFTFHIIGKELSEAEISKIQKYAKSCPVIYHNLELIDKDKFIIREEDHVSIETYFRFFIPDLLENNIRKCLYLDSDIICVNNFEKLFEEKLEGYAAGMVYDAFYSDIRYYNRLQYNVCDGYFNAGVLLINLDYWRKNNISKRLITFVNEYPEKCWFHDQDAINYICRGKILPLKVSYNVQNVFFRVFAWKNPKGYPVRVLKSDWIARDKWNEIEEGCNNPVFVHFLGPKKPWKKDSFIPFVKIWRFFLSQTEFRMSFQMKTRLKLFLKKLIKKEVDNYKYPPESYEIENKVFLKLKTE